MKELLDAIIAAPDDDAPRRVYADALLEQGELLGEFIHLQLDLAAGGLARADAIARRKRERELWTQHGDRWSAPLMALGAAPTFRRGFIDRVSLTAERFAASAGEIFEAAPLARTVSLDGIRGFQGDWVSDDPDVPPEVPLAKFAAAMASPHLARVHDLDAWVGMDAERDGAYGLMQTEWSLGDAALPTLIDALPRLAQLRGLTYSPCNADALIATGLLAQLERLDLAGFDESSVARILDAAPRLRKLRLPELDHHIDILSHPRIAQLEHLAVRFDYGYHEATSRSEAGAHAMSQPNLANLRTLVCDVRSDVNAPIVRAIANSPHLANLVELDLCAHSFTAYRPLASAAHLESLRVLRIDDVGSGDVDDLKRWPLLRRLELLQCWRPVPGFDGVLI